MANFPMCRTYSLLSKLSYQKRKKIYKFKKKLKSWRALLESLDYKINDAYFYYSKKFNLSVDDFIFNIKRHERKYPHSFTYGVFLFISTAGYLGFMYGVNVDVNVPPKEVAYLAGALIAGLVGFLIHESNKESEIGKHREKWLSELKEEVSSFLSNTETYCVILDKWFDICKRKSSLSSDVGEKYYEEAGELKRSINKEYNKISLFIKTDKEKSEKEIYEQFRDAKNDVDIIESMVTEMKVNDALVYEFAVKRKMRALCYTAINKSVVLVKDYCDYEWLYIKKGHVSFRLKRALILGVVLFVITTFAGYTVDYYEKPL